MIDFGYRAVHEASVNAKRIIAAYYNRSASHAYFSSCSDGGSEALMEAQRYPQDYDGIIAGAPVFDWTHHFIASAARQFKWFTDPARHIPASKLPAIQSAVSAACPGLTGATDHVIENPTQCRFDPAVLACQGPETDRCLTPLQLETLRMLYAGPSLPSGTLLYRGFAPGAEAGLDSYHFRSGPGSGNRFRMAFGFFRDFVFEDPSWDFNTYDPGARWPAGRSQTGRDTQCH